MFQLFYSSKNSKWVKKCNNTSFNYTSLNVWWVAEPTDMSGKCYKNLQVSTMRWKKYSMPSIMTSTRKGHIEKFGFWTNLSIRTSSNCIRSSNPTIIVTFISFLISWKVICIHWSGNFLLKQPVNPGVSSHPFCDLSNPESTQVLAFSSVDPPRSQTFKYSDK